MKPIDLENLLGKISRLRARFSDGTGGATQEWRAKTEAGEEQQVTLVGAKDLPSLQDDIEAAFVWIWSLKDHVKRYAKPRGISASWLESQATADRALALSADIANNLKHGGDYSSRHPSRSLSSPRLGTISVTVPQSALGSISIGADWTVTTVADPKDLIYYMPILDGEGRTIGDAFAVLECAVMKWEQILTGIEAQP
jgi:hypothetical protein